MNLNALLHKTIDAETCILVPGPFPVELEFDTQTLEEFARYPVIELAKHLFSIAKFELLEGLIDSLSLQEQINAITYKDLVYETENEKLILQITSFVEEDDLDGKYFGGIIFSKQEANFDNILSLWKLLVEKYPAIYISINHDMFCYSIENLHIK